MIKRLRMKNNNKMIKVNNMIFEKIKTEKTKVSLDSELSPETDLHCFNL